MHTKERAFRCKIRRCGSLRSIKRNSRPKSVTIHKIGSGGRKCNKSRSTKTSLVRRRPLEDFAQHESALTLVSDTLMNVGHRLGGVLNKPQEGKGESRSSIKRVYLIKFDKKASNSPMPSKRENTRQGEDYRHKMNGPLINHDDLHLEGPSSSNGRAQETLSSEDSVTNLLECDSTREGDNSQNHHHTQNPTTESKRTRNGRPKYNYKILYREKLPKRNATGKSSTIPDIFNAILNEIDSVSKRHESNTLKNKLKPKKLSDILESNESLITSDYSIPRAMVNKETVKKLQTLIEHISKKRENCKSSRRSDESKVTEQIPQALSHYAAMVDERDESSNMITSSSTQSGPICRICHERNGTLVRPCQCRGTMAYVHVECLQFWLTEKEVNYCELCNFTFQIIHVPEYKVLPSIGFWYKFAATNQQRRRIIKDLTLAIILLPFLIILTIFVKSITKQPDMEYDDDEEYDDNYLWHFIVAAVKFVTFIVNLSYVVGVLFRINRHLGTWLSWFINKNVTVVLEDLRTNSAGFGDELN